jgi:formate dehydrogenase iron-sulfur subunit
MLACPFHIPRYEWDSTTPYVVKCDMCVDRTSNQQHPACVDGCPEGALKFGERDLLLGEAHGIISKMPGRYVQHVWGEREFGGTSVLYISDVDLASLGWPDQAAVAIPSLTEPLVHKTPFIGLGVAVGLIGLNWIVKRRNELAGAGDDNE